MSPREQNVGKKVTWRPRPCDAPRTGVIITYVPAYFDLHEIMGRAAPEVRPPREHRALRKASYPRYLIRCSRVGSRGQVLQPEYLVPHAGVIDKALAEAEKLGSTVVMHAKVPAGFSPAEINEFSDEPEDRDASGH